jgi:hypothetical protein
MSRDYDGIDADGHVLEAPDLWLNSIEAKFRDRAPRLGITSDGTEVLQLEEQELTDNGAAPGESRSDRRDRSPRRKSLSLDQVCGRPGGRLRSACAYP